MHIGIRHAECLKVGYADLFFGPKMALTYRLDAISQGPKNSRFPLPLAQVMDVARIKSITHGAA